MIDTLGRDTKIDERENTPRSGTVVMEMDAEGQLIRRTYRYPPVMSLHCLMLKFTGIKSRTAESQSQPKVIDRVLTHLISTIVREGSACVSSINTRALSSSARYFG